MTNEERKILDALDCCGNRGGDCRMCPYNSDVNDAISLEGCYDKNIDAAKLLRELIKERDESIAYLEKLKADALERLRGYTTTIKTEGQGDE